ncbi:hypothetical protein KPL70_025530 [Citrus sinensis]|uniref:probable LRR receptor-like serine/threonine-protein kinase At3g47570 n=1 Tax=Citrus sinensis TaxID=2711 RepID=UPI00219A8873|nr:probable LRR receptor-like serine/threonine-protein kinase At3g47570 [Citrus sinensis]KAH9648303.1 hypothetical protein KPL70_025530 [Citrus sinensis]
MPATIGGLISLKTLSLAYNKLDVASLEILNLSNNEIYGLIPTSLEKLLYLKELSLSFNKLEGEILRGGPFVNFTAMSFKGNEPLCGSPNLQVPPCKLNKPGKHQKSRKNMLPLVIVLPLSTALIIVVIILALKYKLTKCGKRGLDVSNDGILPSQATLRRLSYLDLLRATNKFCEENLIGMGSFGSVYRARLRDGIEVAVKVFHQECARALKSFEAQCEVMKSIRHPNLVKVISSCSNDDFKALVLEYMPKGSLENCLYSSTCMLDIFQRLNIMIDATSTLEYLYFGHTTPIIHCDLKPISVLLDEDMVAHLSDFEYGMEGQVSTRSDIYGYGIVLMETFTRKKPTDRMFVEELSLKDWVNNLLPISLMEVVDKTLLSGEKKGFVAKEQCVLSILGLAMECAMELPEKRINAKDIVTRLLKIRDTLSKRLANLD